METVTANDVATVEATEVAAVETSGVVAAEKRTNVSREVFINAWESSNSAQEVADKIGRGAKGVNSCLARASKLRGEGFPLKNMSKGGGPKLDPEKALQLLADIRGVSVEEIRAQGAKLKAKAEQRAAEKATAQAAS